MNPSRGWLAFIGFVRLPARLARGLAIDKLACATSIARLRMVIDRVGLFLPAVWMMPTRNPRYRIL